MAKELKQLSKKNLDLSDNKFTANGQTYLIENTLSFERFREYEKLEVHVGYGTTFDSIFQTLKKLYDSLNKQDFVNAAVIVHNLMHGIKDKMEDRIHPSFMLCALFINTPDEDRAKFDIAKCEKKITDWSKDYEAQGFFSLAVNLVTGFIPAFNEVSQNTLKEKKSKKKNTTKSGA